LVTRNLYTGRDIEPQPTGRSLSVDHQQSVRQLDRLKGLGSLTMLPGHGRPWSGDTSDAVEAAQAAAR
jgi:hypothetical protein